MFIKKIMITPRLDSILKNIHGKTVSDIGTDHAYIPISLVKSGKITRAIACDIALGPLEIARKNVEKYGFSDIIDLRLGAGFDPIADSETETAVIAGMGGEMILNILNCKKAHTFSELILQPMNFQAELRIWLADNNFSIISEDLSREGFKVYNLLTVRHGKMPEIKSEIEAHLPESLYKHQLFPMLYEKKKREFTKILSGLMRAKNRNEELIQKYSFLLEEMKKI